MNVEIIIYLVGIFLFIYILFSQYRQYKTQIAKKNNETVIIRSECPDYWVVEAPNKCRNSHRLGKCLTNGPEGGSMDFTADYFNNDQSGNYAKCRWAKKCNVAWDGIDQVCV